MAQSGREIRARSARLRAEARRLRERRDGDPINPVVGVVDGFVTSVVHTDGVTVVSVSGELDIVTAPRLSELLRLIEGPLVLDCERLTYFDSSGLQVFVEKHRVNGNLTLRNVSAMGRRVLAITGVDEIVNVEGA